MADEVMDVSCDPAPFLGSGLPRQLLAGRHELFGKLLLPVNASPNGS
jgi:hypothetical protein